MDIAVIGAALVVGVCIGLVFGREERRALQHSISCRDDTLDFVFKHIDKLQADAEAREQARRN